MCWKPTREGSRDEDQRTSDPHIVGAFGAKSWYRTLKRADHDQRRSTAKQDAGQNRQEPLAKYQSMDSARSRADGHANANLLSSEGGCIRHYAIDAGQSHQ